MSGFITTPAGQIPVITGNTGFQELLGALSVRFAFGRMDYSVEPGLYAIGSPTPESPVIVTANYKLTFDIVRKTVAGMNLWILVLNTRGINVWCAAGKGTFGTGEIARLVKKTRLDEVVSHRRIIVPQLGAPGVSAHRVKKLTGFDVVYGPVRIQDLKAFLDNAMIATEPMRKVNFELAERVKVIPVELVMTWPLIVASMLLSSALLLSGVLPSFRAGLIPMMGALLAGVVAAPVLLPYIPFKSFTLKGALVGIIWALMCILLYNTGWKVAIMWLLLLPPVSAYLAFNFTGASTYTSPSGVKWEIQKYIWPLVFWFAAGVVSALTLIIKGFLS